MERVQSLRHKLPQGLLWEIQKFDAHPTADLIRDLEFTRYRGGCSIRARRGYFLNKWLELRRRLENNRTYRQSGRVYQIIDFEIHQMYLVFEPWRFSPDLDNIPDWVREEYMTTKGSLVAL